VFFRELLKCYVKAELMNWAEVTQQYEKELRQGSGENPATEVFGSDEEGDKRWDDFRKRIVEHVSVQDPGVFCARTPQKNPEFPP
jgi:26S proteasome regulatory subunit N5